MQGGSHRARLGARLLHPRRFWNARSFVAVLIAGLLLLGPSAALAQDDDSETETQEGTVRVRAVDDDAQDETTQESEEVSEVSAREMPAAEPTPPPPSAGETIVGFALQYVGYPYVFGGNTPAGFDCSGFTQFVVLNTLGYDIGHAVEGQPGAGAWIDYGAWEPGDLVFFQNTYRAGISHVGIYIGDGLFVHAENEGTGVVITSMYEDYYASRYWGAMRVG
jgi:cell wall-associated NlpC family hydrolase